MKLRFFPYDFQYKIIGQKVFVYLYSKLEDVQKVCVVIEHQPYFYAKVAKVPFQEERFKEISVAVGKHTGKITHWHEVKKKLLGREEKLLKIYTNVPRAIFLISKELESWGMECFEKDISFIQKFIQDTGILPLNLVEADGDFDEKTTLRIPKFVAKSFTCHDHDSLDKLKILSIDIETYAKTRGINAELNPILMIAYSGVDEKGETFRKVMTWKRFPHTLDYLEIVSDEEELLQRFREIVLSYKPDVITGYYTDGFDFPYIKTRADKFRVKLDLGVDSSELEAGYTKSDAKINGVLHLDVFKFIRNIFGKNLQTDSFSLDEVSYELLGHRKHDVDVSLLYQAWDNNPEKLEEFCKYNMHDADLTLKLCQKLFLDMLEFSQICGLSLFDVIRMSFSRLVESYIMKNAVKFDVLAPNRPNNHEITKRMEGSYEGGFVYEPKPGLYDDIVVLDFRSLYPTIITSHNIGPEGLFCSCCKDDKKSRVPGMKEYWFCVKEKKFIPQLLENLIEKRSNLKRAIKDVKGSKSLLEAKSYALKILANSFYGYLGYFGARWYSFESARSTTAYARNYIQETIRKAEEKGFEVCYSDTDSCFILLGKHSLSYAKEFMNQINLDLPGHMKLEFEGYFQKGIFVALKGKETSSEKGKLSGTTGRTPVGAKKKYALMDKEGKLKITGFETVRRNWSKISKEVQEKVLRLVLEEKSKDAVKYVRDVVDKLKKGKIPLSKLVLRTKITRELDSYSSIGPHVAVARRMVARGDIIIPGVIVEYIISKGSSLIREKAKLLDEVKEGEYDCNYYLNHQIIPAVGSIFAVVGYSEDDIFAKSSQKGLGSFFS